MYGAVSGLEKKWMRIFLHWYHHLNEWAMTDIYLIAVFITIINDKLQSYIWSKKS
ncbi:MAG: hypothetical protein D3912_14530 [Candidatus Electrothrix sp. AX1]|nr:hypothetical protein [Candidatus Electrothrix sp. AX1]